jgi:predicted HTH domain antitoxin
MSLIIDIPTQTPISELEMKIIFGGEMYERGFLSLGQAAKVAGLSKRTFIEIMGKYGFSIFQMSEEELLNDIGNV